MAMAMAMAMELRVEISHKEAIKPSSPTPLSLKIYKLSLLEQMAPASYIPLIFWFTVDPAAADHSPKPEDRSLLLKKSLSETLTSFYPFAGRISNSFIECNDQGVDFIEARVNCLVRDILKQPDPDTLKRFVPMQQVSPEAANGRILLVQLNLFECGGLAIGLSLSHKVSDLYTLSKFVNSWAAATTAALGSGQQVMLPEFGCAASFLPPISSTIPAIEFKRREDTVTKRLAFDAPKISLLKARAASPSVEQPTRVEAVTGLIWRCAMAASAANLGGSSKPSALRQVVNLRKRMKLKLSDNSVGYLVSYFIVRSDDSAETQLPELTKRLRNGIEEFSEKYVKKLEGNDAISTIAEAAKRIGNLSKRDDVDFYNCMSWCRFDVYEADFGWGKPIWVSAGATATQRSFVLMDGRDGGEGMEVWVSLSQPEMAIFEQNEELLAFASVNPSICQIN